MIDRVNTLVFAKELFHIIDSDSNDFIVFEELVTALVGLGITSD